MLRYFGGAILLLSVVSSVAKSQNASFRGLGDFAGGEFRSEARAISADGRFVVGSSANDSTVEQAFRWSAESGMTSLGLLLGATNSIAEGVSGDGSVVTGYAAGSGSTRPFRWTLTTGMQVLEPGAETAYALDISDDGQSIVGGYGSSTILGGGQQAFRWTTTGQYEFIGLPDNGSTPSAAFAVSNDGSVAVVSMRTFIGVQAFRWTSEEGMLPLGDLPGGQSNSIGYGVSADGRVVVGESGTELGIEAFRWTAETGMIGLGDLPGGDFNSTALATSADGLVTVGTAVMDGRTTAFVWDQAHGMRSLQSVLEAEHALDLDGWRLSIASGISADGLTIVGNGTNPTGQIEAWIAVIPEPSAIVLAVLALLIGIAIRYGRH